MAALALCTKCLVLTLVDFVHKTLFIQLCLKKKTPTLKLIRAGVYNNRV